MANGTCLEKLSNLNAVQYLQVYHKLLLNASRSQELARKKSSGTQSNIFHELEGAPSRVSMNRSVCLNLNAVEPPVSDHMRFLSYNMCSSMF